MVAASISLTVGIYEDLTTIEYDSSGNRVPGVKWVEGVAILFAVVLVVLVGSINDYQKEKQFRRLNAQKQHRELNVRGFHLCHVYFAHVYTFFMTGRTL